MEANEQNQVQGGPSHSHQYWMQIAVDEARSAAKDGEAPVAAVIVQEGAILAVGRNTKTSSNSGFAHAEINALLTAAPMLGRRPKDTVLYVTLEPCAMCLGAIIFSGIGTVVYGAEDELGGAVKMFRSHPTYQGWMPVIVSGVLRTECEHLNTMSGMPAV